ncbi:MAG: hypothetical protein ACYTG5_18460 [Planctomycetota bacterium]
MQEAEQKQGMSPTGKVITGCGCLIAILILALGGYGYFKLAEWFPDDPAIVAELGELIAPGFKAPPGYEAQGVDMWGVRFVMYSKPDGNIITVGPSDWDTDDQVRRETRTTGQSINEETTKLASETLAVSGQDVVFEKDLVVSDEGVELLQMEAVVMNRAGEQLKIILAGPEDSFDREGMLAFLAEFPIQGS